MSNEQIRNRFAGQVEFFVEYVQEAYPTDGREFNSDVTEGVLFRQHQTFDEREEVAQTCRLDLHIALPVLVEEMDNLIDEVYDAAPERLHLTNADGRIAYQGGMGPHFFNRDEWEQALEVCVGKAEVAG